MKILIGGIIGGLVVVVVVLSAFILTDTPEEKETIHPCQELLLDLLLLIEKMKKFDKYTTSLQEFDTFVNQVDEIEQLIIDNNCENTKSEWLTDEFLEKIPFMRDYGF